MLRFMFVMFLFAGSTLWSKHASINLQKALALRLVKTKVLSLGGHQGRCAKLILENLTQDSMLVLVEAGRKLNSLEEMYQDILLVKNESVLLARRETKAVIVNGFCCQAGRSSPCKNSISQANEMADSNLVRLARYLNAYEFENSAAQHAVWAISDHHSTAAITVGNDSLTKSLREFVAILKDEPLPWYTLETKSYVHKNGEIEVIPLVLRGSLGLIEEENDYVTCMVMDELGRPTIFIKEQWLGKGKKEFPIDVPLTGIKKGKYVLVLKTKDDVLARKEFEI
ncbi:MAG: hypothetical protein PSX36_14640 [bacterium]|nr:hypothetical protein [bacterium]